MNPLNVLRCGEPGARRVLKKSPPGDGIDSKQTGSRIASRAANGDPASVPFSLRVLAKVLRRFGVQLVLVPDGDAIPGSYWGDTEAGLVDNRVYVRADTPVHSALHEACHYICMSPDRRTGVHTDAGGDDLEECAVCYLQILLSDHVSGVGRNRMLHDMDAWGYSFRLGAAGAWFARDSSDAAGWLRERGLIDEESNVTWCVRR